MSRLVVKRTAQVLDHLHYLYLHEKGLRSTRELADSFAISIDAMRRILHALADEGLVDCYDGKGTGDPLLWRFAPEKGEHR